VLIGPVPFLPIDHCVNRISKVVRIRRLTQYLSAGRLKFKAGSRGARMLVEQLRDFPNGDHDDGPDALEMAIRLAIQLLSTPQGQDRIDIALP
jgi:predicted phage terminase large subunit-like protein